MKTCKIPVILLFFILAFTKPHKIFADVIFDDGVVHNINYFIGDDVQVHDSISGEFTTLNLLPGGKLNYQLYSYDNCAINIYAGTIRLDLLTMGSSRALVHGGFIGGGLMAGEESTIKIFGGSFGSYIYTGGSSQIFIYGSDFKIDGISVGYGVFTHTGSGYSTYGRLTGILSNGDPIDNDFYIWQNGSITLIPEPSTISFLALGCFGSFLKNRIH